MSFIPFLHFKKKTKMPNSKVFSFVCLFFTCTNLVRSIWCVIHRQPEHSPLKWNRILSLWTQSVLSFAFVVLAVILLVFEFRDTERPLRVILLVGGILFILYQVGWQVHQMNSSNKSLSKTRCFLAYCAVIEPPHYAMFAMLVLLSILIIAASIWAELLPLT